jgi:GH15 family glucan-1,4-alpha-glucosidase
MTSYPTSAITSSPLVAASIAVIKEGQSPEGAYLACPAFPTYCYSWFRDGAFIAEAMDEWGQHQSAEAFHEWVIRTLGSQALLVSKIRPDEEPDQASLLHTRYCADGTPGSAEWPNFQLDGLGTWLWAFQRHLERTQKAPTPHAMTVTGMVAKYLLALWPRHNFDCWEEHPDKLHPSTLGAIYAGLEAASKILADSVYSGGARAARSYLLTHGVRNGHFTKHVGGDEVDANLLWLTVPYRVLDPRNAISRATAQKIREDLLDPEGGVRRYRRDTYYGGGSWIILSAALGQDHLAVGERAEAERLLAWIEAQATREGHLPEQTAGFLNDPTYLSEWEQRWGASACPLLWSHASYLSLVKAIHVDAVEAV